MYNNKSKKDYAIQALLNLNNGARCFAVDGSRDDQKDAMNCFGDVEEIAEFMGIDLDKEAKKRGWKLYDSTCFDESDEDEDLDEDPDEDRYVANALKDKHG